jgi:hypothetical protein
VNVTSGPKPVGGSLDRLRIAALFVLVAGAVSSLALMLYAGRRNPSHLLIIAFVVWVLSPFVALGWANLQSIRWPRLVRTTLYGVTLALALATVMIYGNVVWHPPKSSAAFVFVVVPPASWLLMSIAVGLAVLIARRPPARD